MTYNFRRTLNSNVLRYLELKRAHIELESYPNSVVDIDAVLNSILNECAELADQIDAETALYKSQLREHEHNEKCNSHSVAQQCTQPVINLGRGLRRLESAAAQRSGNTGTDGGP